MKESITEPSRRLPILSKFRTIESLLVSVIEWSHIFRSFSLSESSRVVEFGCGFSPKIQLALKRINFAGRLVLVDIDSQALIAQNKFTPFLRPKFKVEIQHISLFKYPFQPEEIIVGNHIIDDIIASEFARKFDIDYTKIYKNHILQRHFWEDLQKENITMQVTTDKLSKKIGTVELGTIVLNNYLSLFDMYHRLENRNQVCNAVLCDLTNKASKLGFQDIRSNLQLFASKKTWLAVRR